MPSSPGGFCTRTIAALALVLAIVSCSQQPDPVSARDTSPGSNTGGVAPSNSSANIPATENAGLAASINSTIEKSAFRNARWGIAVFDESGHSIYSRDPNGTFIPASNLKVYTTAIALDLLGPDYRWRTSVLVASPPDTNGTLAGDLYLYGRGDPELESAEIGGTDSSLEKLARDVKSSGVRRISGDVIGDESYFTGERYGDGWLWNDLQWYYGAAPSALTINSNEIDVTIDPAHIDKARPQTRLNYGQSLFEITNEAKVVSASMRSTFGIERGLSDNRIHVWGDFPAGRNAITARIAVFDPASIAAALFRNALEKQGIVIEGKTRTRDYRSGTDTKPPQSLVELAWHESRSLSEIVKQTNKESINLNAEILFRTVGKQFSESVSPKSPGSAMQGDDAAARAVEVRWLAERQIDSGALSIHDGSGLSRLDFVTPSATAKLLASVLISKHRDEFISSLPEGGKDGTLSGRLKDLPAHTVFAKTGTLTAVNSLSGFATTRSGRQLVFSIFCNDEAAATGATGTIDEIVRLLVGVGNGR